ncbi:hypothetical protein HNY73_000098 [Argiope bruennichi]|uniref:Uncharacterized protein n=1 Tax=Argiope bruennichi TaxID=94029 RepID=A0A8T0G2X5_ARGBR|nr:hypothetical protein HNY73_000098 [Argiope bruennichi]
MSRDCVRRELRSKAPQEVRLSSHAVRTLTREAEEWASDLDYMAGLAMRHRKGRQLIKRDFETGKQMLGLGLSRV